MRPRQKAALILQTLFVWGLAGALFGGLFSGLLRVLALLGLKGSEAVVFAAAGAAGTTATFYSAMPVALVGAMAGVVASLGYLIVGGLRVQLLPLSAASAAAGMVAGAIYAWLGMGGGRSFAETLTGLIAGLVAGGILWAGLDLYGTDVGVPVQAAGIVVLVGSLFKLAEGPMARGLIGRLPGALSVPVVAGLIAAVVGVGVWLMGGTTAWSPDSITKDIIDQVLKDVPAGLLGGMAGGALTGALLEILGLHLEEDEHVV
jgi:hypothetical protein